MGANSIFSLVTDASTIVPREHIPSWRAAVNFVEDAQILCRNSAAVPWQLPAPASGPQLTLSAGFTSDCFSVLFCALLEALSLWQIDDVTGGVPSGCAAICPPPTGTTQRHHHFRVCFLSASRKLLCGANFSFGGMQAPENCVRPQDKASCLVKIQRI